MKFKFSLDPVLKIRKHQEKLRKQKLAEELMKKKKIDDIKADVQEKLEKYIQHTQNGKAEHIHMIKRHGRHMVSTHEQIQKLGSESNAAEKDVGKVREELASAHKDRHILEKMKEIEQQVFTRKAERNEQKNMDEIATQSYSR